MEFGDEKDLSIDWEYNSKELGVLVFSFQYEWMNGWFVGWFVGCDGITIAPFV